MGVSNVVVTSQTVNDKTEWTITTKNGTFKAVDNNGNSRLDSGELSAALSNNGNLISNEDLIDAQYQVAMMNNPTNQEISNYNQFISARDTQAQEAESVTQPKKKGFWGSVGNFFKGVGKGIGSFFKGIGNLMMPIGMGLMAFGGFRSLTGTGDWSSNLNMTMAGAGMAAMGAMNQYSQTLNAMTLPTATTFDISSIGTNTNQYNQLLASLGSNTGVTPAGTTGAADSTGNTDKQKLITELTNAYNNATTLDSTNPGNLEWIKNNIIGKKPEDLTDEDSKIAKQIKNNPMVSYQVIGNATNQITLQESNSIPKIKATYIAQGKTNPNDTQSDNQGKIFDGNYKEKYARMIELSKKATLTEAEATELKALINEASTNIDANGLKVS